jgi:retron-type reverse transcriptase
LAFSTSIRISRPTRFRLTGTVNPRSSSGALVAARERCWKFDWVIDLDIKSFFDTIPHDLIEKAVARHTELGWVRLYVKRWLKAPVERADGTHMERAQGTPQGSVVSPLLAIRRGKRALAITDTPLA